MSYSIALVGAGPTSIYSIQALLAAKAKPAAISIFERQRRAGQGTPYSKEVQRPVRESDACDFDVAHSEQNILQWMTYLPPDCIQCMIKMGWDISTQC
jgi:uncharacterized NAD(P)/FAD-binding protein YdhS